jgi:hypothetical protein
MRAISRRLEKLEKVFAPVAESEDTWGSMAEFPDELLSLAEQRSEPSVAELREELERLGPLGSGARQPAATLAITGSSKRERKLCPNDGASTRNLFSQERQTPGKRLRLTGAEFHPSRFPFWLRTRVAP